MPSKSDSRGSARTSDRAQVERYPDETRDRYLTIRCETCGAQIDRVEFQETDGPNPHVRQLVSLLGCSESDAEGILGEQNPDLLMSSEERARDLAEQIVAKSVPDRDKGTYTCPNGHTDGLKVTE